MSNQITVNKDLITEERINGNGKIVYMYLKLLSKQENPVTITLYRLSEYLFLSENTVKTSLRTLEDIGYIKINKEKNPKGYLTNTYEVIERES